MPLEALEDLPLLAIDRLADDVVLRILLQLPELECWAACELVCRGWRALVRDNRTRIAVTVPFSSVDRVSWQLGGADDGDGDEDGPQQKASLLMRALLAAERSAQPLVELRVNCASSHVTPRFWSNREIKAFTQVVKDAASSLEVLEVTGPAGFFPSASHAGGRRREPISESRELDPALEALFEAACESEDRASPTHLCPPLHHYVHHRSAPRRPRSQLQRVRRDAITVRRSFSERRSSAARSHWRGGVADSAPACSACRLHLGEHRSSSPRFLPIGPHPSLPSPRHTSHHQPAREQVPLHAGRLRARGGGRVMTLTKTKLRSSLSDEHFEQSVWVAYNSPGIHEVDLQAFVERWRLDGHLSATMSGGGERAREVLDRKARERKHTFLAMAREGE